MYDLSGRVAMVTGGAGGIGYAISTELVKAGCRVVIANRDLQKASAVAEEIGRSTSMAVAVQLDVTNSQSVERCVQGALSRVSHIDILVNSAGIFQRRLGLDVEDEDFSRCLDVNLTGVWRMVQALVPQFRQQGRGNIINIASTGGRRGVSFAPAYCASKAAVINLTESLAVALGGYRINVNAICPGAIPNTAMLDEILALRGRLGVESRGMDPLLPLEGPLTVEDVGHAVVFFASERARNITGQALSVDCGWLLR